MNKTKRKELFLIASGLGLTFLFTSALFVYFKSNLLAEGFENAFLVLFGFLICLGAYVPSDRR